MKQIQILNKNTSEIIFQHTCEDNSMKLTVEEAVKQKVSLAEADLSAEDLRCANLYGGVFVDASFQDAFLGGAVLRGANLRYADFTGALLHCAHFDGADFTGAKFDDAGMDDTLRDRVYSRGPRLNFLVRSIQEHKPLFVEPICLHEDTLVRMADLSVKKIKDIVVGEWVLGSDMEGVLRPTLVKNVFHNGFRNCYSTIRGEAEEVGKALDELDVLAGGPGATGTKNLAYLQRIPCYESPQALREALLEKEQELQRQPHRAEAAKILLGVKEG